MYKLLATWLEWSNQLRKPSCPIFSCRLVDSRDIVELKLKQHDVEVTIRKKEAMPQPPPPPQPAVVYSSPPPVLPPPSVPASTPAPTLARATPSPTSAPAVKSAKSSLPPLKSPMAGTFYRSPAPGEPPFVKVDLIYCIILYFCVMNFWNLMWSILPLGWRQSKEGASCMHHWGNEIDEWNRSKFKGFILIFIGNCWLKQWILHVMPLCGALICCICCLLSFLFALSKCWILWSRVQNLYHRMRLVLLAFPLFSMLIFVMFFRGLCYLTFIYLL